MKVSRSGFYDYRKRYNRRAEDPSQASLKARIGSIFKEHKGNYGSRRILEQLQDEGHQIGRYKVRSLMRKLGLKANQEDVKKVAAEMAKNLASKKIDTVVFDRNGYLYHGVVASFADALREAGIKF